MINLIIFLIINYKSTKTIYNVLKQIYIRFFPVFGLFLRIFDCIPDVPIRQNINYNDMNAVQLVHEIGIPARNSLITEQYDHYIAAHNNGTINRREMSNKFSQALYHMNTLLPKDHLTIDDLAVVKYMATIQPFPANLSATLKGVGNANPIHTRDNPVLLSSLVVKESMMVDLRRSKLAYDLT